MDNENFKYGVDDLIKRYPELSVCKDSILDAFNILKECFLSCHTLYVAGNGGSCSDAEHIVGELMKGFKKRRHLSSDECNELTLVDPIRGKELADSLQWGFPCIALNSHPGLSSAFINDVANGGLMTYAQQLNVLGKQGDVFLGISTSGNSKNIMYASVVARAKGLKVIGLTGEKGGELAKASNVCIKAPSSETFMIQEYHLPIYHCLCLMLEEM